MASVIEQQDDKGAREASPGFSGLPVAGTRSDYLLDSLVRRLTNPDSAEDNDDPMNDHDDPQAIKDWDGQDGVNSHQDLEEEDYWSWQKRWRFRLATSRSPTNSSGVSSQMDPSTFSSAGSQCSCISCCQPLDPSPGPEELRRRRRRRRPSRIMHDTALADFYDLKDVLGEGSFSTVFLAESKQERFAYAAVKVIQKQGLRTTPKIIPRVSQRPGDSYSSKTSDTVRKKHDVKECNKDGVEDVMTLKSQGGSRDSAGFGSAEDDDDDDADGDCEADPIRPFKVMNVSEAVEEEEEEEEEQEAAIDGGEETDDDDQDLTCHIDREIRVLSDLDHPHIVKLMEVFEDSDTACFVMELAKGGELFDRLLEASTGLREPVVADHIVQLLSALDYLHQRGIVHRDLKLENILYYDDTEDSKIMLADFGLSEWEINLPAGSPVCGTPSYLAPEVICRQACTTKADMWAVGVITYSLLAGHLPFYAELDEPDTDATVLRKIVQGHYTFSKKRWAHITEDAKHFVTTLLTPDPARRPSAEEALKHPWLTERDHLEQKIAARRQKAALAKRGPKNLSHTSSGSREFHDDSLFPHRWSGWMTVVCWLSFMTLVVTLYTSLAMYIFSTDFKLLAIEGVSHLLDRVMLCLAESTPQMYRYLA